TTGVVGDGPVAAGDTLQFALTFTNSGTAVAQVDAFDQAADVFDDAAYVAGSLTLPAGLNWSASPGQFDPAGTPAVTQVEITGGLAAGATATVTYQVKVNATAGLLAGGWLQNYLPSTPVVTPPPCPPGGMLPDGTSCT